MFSPDKNIIYEFSKKSKYVSRILKLHARVYQFPTSALKINNKKINYYNFISSCENADCTATLERVLPRIDMVKIYELIDNTEHITDLQKEFYKKYITARHEKILKSVK